MANYELKVQLQNNAPVVENFDELKAELSTALIDYKEKTYTEADIVEAKNDRAKLNKLKTTLDTERKERKKDFMKPFEAFESQLKELCSIVDEVSSGIGEQLDAFEQKRITEKQATIQSLFDEIKSNYDALDFITLDKIANEKWLNKSVSDKAIAKEITEICDKVVSDLEIIKRMPEYSFEAEAVYKQTLNLNNALAEGERMSQIAKQKAEAEKKQTEAQKFIELCQESKEEPNEPVYDFKFACRITQTQAIALKQFCNENKIKLIRI